MCLIKQMSEAFQLRDFSSKTELIDQHTYLYIQF